VEQIEVIQKLFLAIWKCVYYITIYYYILSSSYYY